MFIFQGTSSQTLSGAGRVRGKLPGSALMLGTIGAIVVLLLMLKGIVDGRLHDRQIRELLARPAVGDVYILAHQTSPGVDVEFDTVRIEQVTSSVLRTHSGHVYESEHEARRALRSGDESFDDTQLVDVPRATLQSQHESGELIAIERGPHAK